MLRVENVIEPNRPRKRPNNPSVKALSKGSIKISISMLPSMRLELITPDSDSSVVTVRLQRLFFRLGLLIASAETPKALLGNHEALTSFEVIQQLNLRVKPEPSHRILKQPTNHRRIC